MSGLFTLLGGAIVLRIAGALARISRTPTLGFLTWLLCPVSVWTAAGIFGMFAPIWPVLVVFVLGVVRDLVRPQAGSTIIAEAALAFGLGLISLPSLPWIRLLAMTILIPGAGVLIDKGVRQFPFKSVSNLVVFFATAAVIFVVVYLPRWMPLLPAQQLHQIPDVCVATPYQGEKVVLKTGVVAWFNRPTGAGPFPGVVFFHGANALGSMQPAACSLRRAFVHAGFAVLAVDRAGYGASAAVPADAPLESWDALPADLDAVAYLRSREDVDRVFAAGHSMGVADVLRLLGRRYEIQGGFVIAGSHLEEAVPSRYWYDRFHADRRMTDRVSERRFQEIFVRFEDRLALAAELPSDHPPVLYMNFAYEWDNVKRTRGPLFEAIPGAKRLVEIEGTHYMNTLSRAGVIVAHASPVLFTAERIKKFYLALD